MRDGRKLSPEAAPSFGHLAEWFWDALARSAVQSRNELVGLAGYGRSLVYDLFDGKRLPRLEQVHDLAQALGAEPGDVDDLWYAAKRSVGTAEDPATKPPDVSLGRNNRRRRAGDAPAADPALSWQP